MLWNEWARLFKYVWEKGPSHLNLYEENKPAYSNLNRHSGPGYLNLDGKRKPGYLYVMRQLAWLVTSDGRSGPGFHFFMDGMSLGI